MTILAQALLLFEEYTYLILFLWILAETLGVPIAGEIVLLLAGSLLGSELIHLFGLMTIGIVAALIGDTISFYLGMNFFENGFKKALSFYCRYTVCSGCTFTKTERYFKKWGGFFIVFARFVLGVRALAAPFSGMMRVPMLRFWFFDIIGLFLWTGFYLFIGRIFGKNWDFKGFSMRVVIFISVIFLFLMGYKYLLRLRHGPTPVEMDEAREVEDRK